jgi:hypothetical protein
VVEEGYAVYLDFSEQTAKYVGDDVSEEAI